jgi:fumarate reductase flavoprotein subunit
VPDHINRNLREVKEICGHFLGIDPIKDWIPVRPAQHYTMGGVRTNHTGESPTLRGLFAAGEAACWDLHGFNRLGGNSVAETVVGGMIVGEYIADFCDRRENHAQLSTGLVGEFLSREQRKLDAFIDGSGKEEANTVRGQMQDLMTAKVGIFAPAKTSRRPSRNCRRCCSEAATSDCATARAATIRSLCRPTGSRRC